MTDTKTPTPGVLKPVTTYTRTSTSTVILQRGEFVTVFIDANGSGRNMIQVELHIDGAGTPRVLLRKENMGIVATYKEVYGE